MNFLKELLKEKAIPSLATGWSSDLPPLLPSTKFILRSWSWDWEKEISLEILLIFMYTHFSISFSLLEKERISYFLLKFNTQYNKINRRLEMRVFFSHPFFIPLSEQKSRMQRNGNIWYIKPRSDRYKSKYKYRNLI